MLWKRLERRIQLVAEAPEAWVLLHLKSKCLDQPLTQLAAPRPGRVCGPGLLVNTACQGVCPAPGQKAEERAAISGHRKRKELVGWSQPMGLIILPTGKADVPIRHSP